MHEMQLFYFIANHIILEDVSFWSDSSLDSIIGLLISAQIFTKIIGYYPLSINETDDNSLKSLDNHFKWVSVYRWCIFFVLGKRYWEDCSPRAHLLNPLLNKVRRGFSVTISTHKYICIKLLWMSDDLVFCQACRCVDYSIL